MSSASGRFHSPLSNSSSEMLSSSAGSICCIACTPATFSRTRLCAAASCCSACRAKSLVQLAAMDSCSRPDTHCSSATRISANRSHSSCKLTSSPSHSSSNMACSRVLAQMTDSMGSTSRSNTNSSLTSSTCVCTSTPVFLGTYSGVSGRSWNLSVCVSATLGGFLGAAVSSLSTRNCDRSISGRTSCATLYSYVGWWLRAASSSASACALVLPGPLAPWVAPRLPLPALVTPRTTRGSLMRVKPLSSSLRYFFLGMMA
mmetsp:Transcript_36/g.68  ORF Transcript_36/g.68 Transcript_36/m.68 type:complete len:259 (+) Transcript_36:690-1466(+)